MRRMIERDSGNCSGDIKLNELQFTGNNCCSSHWILSTGFFRAPSEAASILVKTLALFRESALPDKSTIGQVADTILKCMKKQRLARLEPGALFPLI